VIARVLSQDKFLSDVAYHFSPHFAVNLQVDVDTIETRLGTLDISQSQDEFGNHFVGGYSAGKLVAYITVSRPDADKPVPFEYVGYSIVERPHRGHGLTRALIDWWIARYGRPLLSDEGQTDESRRVWESMILRDPILDFELWRRDEDEFHPLTVVNGIITPDPWDGSPSRLLARPRGDTNPEPRGEAQPDAEDIEANRPPERR
jgi:hypothetical protein